MFRCTTDARLEDRCPSRNYYLRPAILFTFSLFVLICFRALAHEDSDPDMIRFYVGTYTTGESEGIYLGELDRTEGTFQLVGLAGEAANPSFLALHPTESYLYAVGELGNYNNRAGGAVFAFAINEETGMLTALNSESSLAGAPCHIAVDATGQSVYAANYSGGNVIGLPLKDDGSVGPVASLIQHEGAGPHESRQEKAHAHCVNLDPSNNLLLVCDLGVDRIYLYDVDHETAELTPHDPPFASLKPGDGPRHLAFHPNNEWVYVINELASTITSFAYDVEEGELEEFQTISTLPEEFEGQSTTAEVVVHPSGRFVYGSNRGHESIAVFAVDQETGQLTFVEHESCGGSWPRCFAVDPTGRYMIVANQKTNNIVLYEIDQENGELTPTGDTLEVGAPVCILFQ
jgi:6-phosphogluconolactonase